LIRRSRWPGAFFRCIGSLAGVGNFQLGPGLIRDQPHRIEGYSPFHDPRSGAVSPGVAEAGPTHGRGIAQELLTSFDFDV